jgi:uncharacterized protein (TIGR03118 family)
LRRTRPNRIAPRLELLEDRTVPSTLTVTSAADSGTGSLRAEIAAANSGDTINFARNLIGQTIALTSGELAINKSLDIEGPGAKLLTISGKSASRIFNISGSSTNVEIERLTIANGLVSGIMAVGPFGNVTMGGGILNTGAHVALSGVTMTDNKAFGSQNGYVQTNLVSDLASENAQITDPTLKNPWGISESASGPFWVSNQKTNSSTLYSVTAAGISKLPLTVAIPTTAAGPQGPTGQVSNDTSSFLVNGAPASFIFANLNGTLSAWNKSAGTAAQVEATTAGAAYTGLDIESTTAGDFLYAANAKQGRIDVFNSSFALTSLGPNAFKVPTGALPSGLVPFNVEGVNGDLYVTYAPAGPPAARNMAPLGAGAIAVFDTSGNFIKVLTSGGNLASPWGVTLAPSTFGKFGGDLLVGNFSYNAGEINAFDPVSGAYLGTLTDSNGNTLLAGSEGIWDMSFGNGGKGGLPGTLYFATGLNAENDGLFGAIDALPGIATGGAIANVSGGTLDMSHSTFTDNQAVGAVRGSGGAIANDASSLMLDNSTFAGNKAITVLGSVTTGGIQGNALSGAVYNAGGGQATISDTTFKYNSAHGGNGADGTSTVPNGGNAGTGVGGAVGNEAISLLGPFAPSTMTLTDSLFLDNQAIGGTGGNGAAVGNGGNGSSGGLSVAGGAINNGSSTLTVSGSTFFDNEAIGGIGGNGGVGGNGGAGSNGAGGAISSVPTPSFVTGTPLVRATLHVRDSLFLGNEAIGGAGGAGGSVGNGGNGGSGQGGGLRTSLTDWDVSNSLFLGNQAVGGTGGSLGGNGGAGQGGALINFNGAIGTVSDSVLLFNEAEGGAGGLGGNGGDGQGGGAFNGTPAANGTASSLTFQRSAIAFNEAEGGAAGIGGLAGQGVGGGVYNLGAFSFDVFTIIKRNHASTSNDDIFP